LIYPAAIGGDIGCGMAAVRFDANADLLDSAQTAERVLAGLHERVPMNRHAAATMPRALPASLVATALSDARLEKLKGRDGRVQFGTLGSGNHFVEFQADQENQLWLMVHSGSRAMGQAITAHHVDRESTLSNGLKYLDADGKAGAAYLNDIGWALRYAEQSRLAMVTAISLLLRRLLGVDADWSSLIHGHHNHVRREAHFGTPLWVHRKGAQSARRDEPGIIPGSMGTASYHVAGRACKESLCSSSHGAGRELSRTQARRTISTRRLRQQMKSVWFDHHRAAGLRDEAPAAYKDIHKVMRAQKELVRITRELRPLLSYKGR